MPSGGDSEPPARVDPERRRSLHGLAALGAWVATGAQAQPQVVPDALAVGVQDEGLSPRPLTPAFLGFNGNLVGLREPWSDSKLLQAFRQLQVGNLRYPGGTVANFWDWEEGAIDGRLKGAQMGSSRHLLAHRAPSTRYRLEDLGIVVRETGVTPIFVANMVSYGVEEQIGHLKRARALGMPVSHVELGNEYYFGRGAHPVVDDRFPEVDLYAAAVRVWSRRLKSEFPGVHVAALAAGPVPDASKSARRRKWDERLFSQLDGADALTVHTYTRPGIGDTDAEFDAGVQKEGATQARRRSSEHLRSPAGVAALLRQPRASVRTKLPPDHYPRGVALWLTEFNVFDSAGGVRGTWGHGLAVAGYVDSFLRDPRVALACYHNLFAQAMFSAIWRSPNEVRNALGEEAALPVKYTLTGPGVAMKVVLDALKGMSRAREARIVGQPGGPGADAAVADAAFWILSDGRNERGLFMNFSASPLHWNPRGGRSPAFTAVRSFSARPDALISVDGSAVYAGPRPFDGHFPEYSLCVLQ